LNPQNWGNHELAKVVATSSSCNIGLGTMVLYGGSLLVGLGLELYLFIAGIVRLKRSGQKQTASQVVTLLLSGAGVLLLGSPIAIGLVGSLLPH